MAIYKGNYLPENTIAVNQTISNQETHSKISINWLEWIAKKENIHIQHALNSKEKKIKNIGKVDGFCESTKTVYEFQGCFWHGCGKCVSDDTINTSNQIDMLTLRKKTKEKK